MVYAHTAMSAYDTSGRGSLLLSRFCRTRVRAFNYDGMQGLHQCARPARDVHQGISTALQEYLCEHGLPQVYSCACFSTQMMLHAV